ncbi:ATP-dependent helicase [Parasporobacterium paucivorans]|uniref:DNA 3'-5' helicase n=1 Tax=Parasporobacterium paucivorans DSM 15970 TaxID=1122934 RepID=A0A1M6FN41_9FIRM|nr:ATP-dependent helicase [Parasporobacterium paucivorans]SHI99107.1 DNA helicase-2 / ATP-dependent DNA helicase PcrA [Parasporobacterium paucivorans DSM 15970]
MNLNQSQTLAVSHNTGPMLVAAGPGSGKTSVITARIQNLIERYGLNPSNILVITFTRAAADQMKDRFRKITDGLYPAVTFGTFHAIYFNIIKHAYNFSSANILQEEQKKQYLREIIIQQGIETEDENDLISSIISEISLIKGERISLDHYYSQSCSDDVFRKIYGEYESQLQSINRIDFDDILLICYELLKERKDILAIWQKKYTYILIDEFQDINKIQYDIIKMIASGNDNIFAVGDDDQSVYRFRGSKPEIMLNFGKDYPDAKKVFLDINYRSLKRIVKASLNLIKNNRSRYEKQIIAVREEGGYIDIRNFPGQKEENLFITEKIRKYMEDGMEPGQIAVLYRTNIGAGKLIEKLMEYNIPFYVKDTLPNLFRHWISQSMIAYIRLALGDRSREMFLKIINRPNRFVSRAILNEKIISFAGLKNSYSDKIWMQDRIEKLERDLQMLSGMNPFSAINYIRKGIGYDEYLREYAAQRRINEEELFDVLEEIQEGAKEFNTFDAWFEHIRKYSEELLKKQGNSREKKNYVQISTMHSAKGLEFEAVFIPDAVEGITPYRKAVSEEELEEERRLFYVAVTRTKDCLHIYSPKEIHNKEMKVSRFVGEMICDFAELIPGRYIIHAKYGEGIIEQYSEGKLKVQFPGLQKPLLFDAKYAVSNNIIRIK